jgi:hypothetical protein
MKSAKLSKPKGISVPPVRAVEALAILLAHPLIGLPLLAVAVVGGALLGVREHLIRLVNLFELLLGLLIARVHIGVILACQLAIRRLDFFLGGVAWHAQYRIVVLEAPHRLSPSDRVGQVGQSSVS